MKLIFGVFLPAEIPVLYYFPLRDAVKLYFQLFQDVLHRVIIRDYGKLFTALPELYPQIHNLNLFVSSLAEKHTAILKSCKNNTERPTECIRNL